MIKISDSFNIDDPEEKLNDLALHMWESLNQKKVNSREYKQNALISKIDKYYNLTNDTTYKSDYANNNNQERLRHRRFFRYLKKYSYENLKKLIVSAPHELHDLRSDIFNILHKEDLFVDNSRVKQTKFGKLLSDTIFAYKNFRVSPLCIDIIEELGFESATCPYCNKNMLDVVKSFNSADDKRNAYLDLDHFYPKSQNPFFSLSFYNLIPCCHTCNSSLKGDKEFCIQTHINPFDKSFNDIYKFDLINDRLQIKYKLTGINTDKTLEDFNLVNRYNTGSEREALDIENGLIDNSLYLSDPTSVYREDCIKLLLKGIPLSDKDILKFPLGKMKRDIFISRDDYSILT